MALLDRSEIDRRLAAVFAAHGEEEYRQALRGLGSADQYDGDGMTVAYLLNGGDPETALRLMTAERRKAVAAVDPETPPIELEPLPGVDMPPLPEAARVDPALGVGACPWLDAYIDYSRQWSPRAYDGFHEACAVWLLSTVAARRVRCPMGHMRYTNLYLAMVARTSLFAKSTTAKIVSDTLRAAGLDWLLAADDATPQRFIADLVRTIPGDYDRLDPEAQQRVLLRAAFPAQRGWFFDEFGMKVGAMLAPGGFMADFRGILRKWDDCPARYEYASIGRGSDIVIEPYLALLANMTPADLRQAARKNDALWGDGFWARFAFVAPPPGANRSRARFPTGERRIPSKLTTPLQEWHQRLGVPEVEVEKVEDEDSKTTSLRARVTPHTCAPLDMAADVWDAFYSYNDGLCDLIEASELPDFDGSYSRFAEKALRVAMLMASLGNSNTIEMHHWARAQDTAERWRAGLHSLYAEVNKPEPSEEASREDKAVEIVHKLGTPTAADVGRYMWGMSGREAAMLLDGLVAAGTLRHVEGKRKGVVRYEPVP